MRNCFLGLLVAFTAMCPNGRAFAQDCSHVFAAYRDATVYIAVERTTKLTGAVKDFNGTGILVSPEGYVLTNKHVVEMPPDVDSVDLTGSTGSNANQKTRMLIIAQDPSQDLALLQIANSDQKYKSIPIDFTVSPVEGSSVCSMGFPMDQDLLVVNGVLSSKIGDYGWWLTDMPINPGDSGAPVFDGAGRLIAIAVAGMKNAQNLNYMIPIFRARPILDYVPPGPPQSTQTVEVKNFGFGSLFGKTGVRFENQNTRVSWGNVGTTEIPAVEDATVKSVTIYDGFRFFAKSTYTFQTGAISDWGAKDSDIGVAKPTGQDVASFFIYYDAPPYTSANGSDRVLARSGIIDTKTSELGDVHECPSLGYSIHYFQPEVGEVYCVRTHDGRHYAKIKISSVDSEQISFQYVYQPLEIRTFN